MTGGWRIQVTNILQKLVREEGKLKRLRLRFLTSADLEDLNAGLVRQALQKVGEFFEIGECREYVEGLNADNFDEVTGEDLCVGDCY